MLHPELKADVAHAADLPAGVDGAVEDDEHVDVRFGVRVAASLRAVEDEPVEAVAVEGLEATFELAQERPKGVGDGHGSNPESREEQRAACCVRPGGSCGSTVRFGTPVAFPGLSMLRREDAGRLGHGVVGAAVEFAPGGFLVAPAPLLKEERHVLRVARVSDA